MAKNNKEVGTKQPDLRELIGQIDEYRDWLYHSKTISKTKFQHMQTALHGVKNIVRNSYGAKPQKENALVK
jgi:hypothetical protein